MKMRVWIAITEIIYILASYFVFERIPASIVLWILTGIIFVATAILEVRNIANRH